MGKGLTSAALSEALLNFAADLILYVPTACATLNALWRCRRLENSMPGVQVVFISLQRREYGLLGRRVAAMLKPKHLIVISRDSQQYFQRLGFTVSYLPMGVDLERFCPVGPEEKTRIRGLLNLPADKTVVLHVGHLGHRRGLKLLEDVAADPDQYTVLVASTATRADEALRTRLSLRGIDVRNEFVANIEHYYQVADLYVFPVENARGSIEFPLSVLEAMACNLPVVTTRFGALGDAWPPGEGLVFLDEKTGISRAIAEALSNPPQTRSKVLEFSWDRLFQRFLENLEVAS